MHGIRAKDGYFRFEIRSYLTPRTPLRCELEDQMGRYGYKRSARIGVGTAFFEALTNAIRWGNNMDETKLVYGACRVERDGVVIDVVDQGTGPVDLSNSLPDSMSQKEMLAAISRRRKNAGLGMRLMRNFMDVEISDVSGVYGKIGTRVHMTYPKSQIK